MTEKAIDIPTMNSLSFIRNLKQEVIDASILYEVSYQERNKRPQEHNHEERQAGYARDVSRLRDEDVQNRKGLSLRFHQNIAERLDILKSRRLTSRP